MFRRLLCGLALVMIVGCGGSDDSGLPSATVAPPDTTERTTSTTEALTPEEEVEAAYLRSWEVYAEAVRELDDSRLDEVYAGDALQLRREELADYRAANSPVVVDVEHDYSVSIFTEGRALVVDSYLNRSVFIDPETAEPTEPPPNEVVNRQYELRLTGGTWKVVYVKSLG